MFATAKMSLITNRLFRVLLRFLLKSLLQYQSFTEAELLPTPSTSSHPALPPASASTSGPLGASGLAGGHNPATAGSTGEEGAHKKPKKERRERGKENGKEEGEHHGKLNKLLQNVLLLSINSGTNCIIS